MNDNKWNEKSRNIILLLIFFSPLGLYYTWKTPIWTLERKITIFLIFIFPLGIYLMFKHNVWSKTKRLVITSFVVLGFIGLSFIPPSINKGSIYKLDNVYDCPETLSGIYFKLKDDNTLLLWSVDILDYKNQCCKTEIRYTKKDGEFVFEDVIDSHIGGQCLSQFMGKYMIKDGKWTNGNVTINLSTSTNDLR